jgi:hypothetical protein
MSELDEKLGPLPMRVQVAPGSEAEYRHYRAAARRSGQSFDRESLAPGVGASPKDDLVFRGGKTLHRWDFKTSTWDATAISPREMPSTMRLRVMRDEQLKVLSSSIFPARHSTMMLRRGHSDENRKRWPSRTSRTKLSTCLTVTSSCLPTTIVQANLILAPDTVLRLGSELPAGLSGYHGSVHFSRNGKSQTLYYSVTSIQRSLGRRMASRFQHSV